MVLFHRILTWFHVVMVVGTLVVAFQQATRARRAAAMSLTPAPLARPIRLPEALPSCRPRSLPAGGGATLGGLPLPAAGASH